MKLNKLSLLIGTGLLSLPWFSPADEIKKYLNGGTEESITFYAQQHANSNQYIVRHGILVRKPGAKATVLICHGFMCDKNDIQFLRSMFSDYNTLVFDFRAHGESIEGQCCSLGADEAYDVLGAAQFIKADEQIGQLPIIVYGFSMGACASILAQAKDASLFAGAIWDCPFDSTEKIFERNIARLKINLLGYDFTLPPCVLSFLQRYAYHPYIQSLLKVAFKTVSKVDASQIKTCVARIDPIEAIKKITIPTLLIICTADEKVPVDAMKQIYSGAAGYKRLWITNGRKHFDSYFAHPEQYTYKVNSFIKKVLKGEISQKKQARIRDDRNKKIESKHSRREE